MVKYEDECCGCAVPAYPCLGDSCPNRHVPHLYCDECKDDVEELYDYEEKEICEECLKEHLLCRTLDDFD
jgi:hypothetical protein